MLISADMVVTNESTVIFLSPGLMDEIAGHSSRKYAPEISPCDLVEAERAFTSPPKSDLSGLVVRPSFGTPNMFPPPEFCEE